MTQTLSVNIVVIGAAGLIGTRHVSHVLSEPSTTLSCIVDPTPAGTALAKTHKIPNYASLDELLTARSAGEVKVDAAIVATPNTTHVPLGIQLLDADITALVEKPLGVTGESCNALLAAEQRAVSRGSVARLATGHHRRHNPYLMAARESIQSGKLGRILAIQGTWATLKDVPYFAVGGGWRRQPGSGGPILINLIHEIDCIRYLLNTDITRVHVERSTPNTRGPEHSVEETVAMTFRFSSGTVGSFVLSDAAASPWNWEAATGENPLMKQTAQNVYMLLGSRGSMAVPELRRWHYDAQDGEGSWTTNIEVDENARGGGELEEELRIEPFTRQLRNLVGVCRGEEEPRCSGVEGAKSLLVVEAVMKSMETAQLVEVEKLAVERDAAGRV